MYTCEYYYRLELNCLEIASICKKHNFLGKDLRFISSFIPEKEGDAKERSREIGQQNGWQQHIYHLPHWSLRTDIASCCTSTFGAKSSCYVKQKTFSN